MNRKNLLNVLLLVSLSLNLLIIGGIASRLMGGREFVGRPLPPTLGWMTRSLSEERQNELSSLLESSNQEIRPYRRKMATGQEQVNSLMVAEPLNSAAIEQAFTELRQSYLEYQQLSHQQTVALLNRLTASERQQAFEFLSSRRPREGADRRSRRNPGIRPGDTRPSNDLPR